MTKLTKQKKLTILALAVLISSPILAYFGSKIIIASTCNYSGGLSFCPLGEIPMAMFIALGLFFVASTLLIIGTMRKK